MMNFNFSLTHNNLVVETYWEGNLKIEDLVTGIVQHNNWVIQNAEKLPLVLIFDFTKADLGCLSETDLQNLASHFEGIESMFPGVSWIAVMPREIKYQAVRMWLEYVEHIPCNAMVVRSLQNAHALISDITRAHSHH